MRCKLLPDRDLREIPQARVRPVAKAISVHASEYVDWGCAIVAAYASGGHSMKHIGGYFGLHDSRVSKAIRNAERAKKRLDPFSLLSLADNTHDAPSGGLHAPCVRFSPPDHATLGSGW
jgi:hypothetical protein